MGDHHARGPASEESADTHSSAGSRRAARRGTGVTLRCAIFATIVAGMSAASAGSADDLAHSEAPSSYEFVPVAALPMPVGPIVVIPESDGSHGSQGSQGVHGHDPDPLMMKRLGMLDPAFLYAMVRDDEDDVAAVMGP
ncbi:MAG: hypothetical protein KC983_08430, partial [Phycisphaerales bacterium]|nr:hypothetical protein [Phycisphaerales bacterium]